MNETHVSEHILIVDDELQLLKLLEKYLLHEGFRVSCAANGKEMREKLEANDIDLVVLDLGLPDQDGFALTRDLRQNSDVAIIIITGRGDEVDRVAGLELGADDYIVKPASPRELAARIRSVLRRAKHPDHPGTAGNNVTPERGGVLSFKGWRLDLGERELYAPDGVSVHLTTAEFELLSALVQAPNQVLSRNTLLLKCAGREWNPVDRSVDIYIGRIRSKIEADPKSPRIVKTIRGTGYMFVAPVERAAAQG